MKKEINKINLIDYIEERIEYLVELKIEYVQYKINYKYVCGGIDELDRMLYKMKRDDTT